MNQCRPRTYSRKFIVFLQFPFPHDVLQRRNSDKHMHAKLKNNLYFIDRLPESFSFPYSNSSSPSIGSIFIVSSVSLDNSLSIPSSMARRSSLEVVESRVAPKTSLAPKSLTFSSLAESQDTIFCLGPLSELSKAPLLMSFDITFGKGWVCLS